jgi:hypothetical protein
MVRAKKKAASPKKPRASTPHEYVAALPPERREVIEKLRSVLTKNLPAGFEETIEYGMLAYVVPLRLYPAAFVSR